METISIKGNIINYNSFEDLKSKLCKLGLQIPQYILDRYNIKMEKLKVPTILPLEKPKINTDIIFEDLQIDSNSILIKQYNLWILIPGNENKTLTDYFNWIKVTQEIDNTWTSTNW